MFPIIPYNLNQSTRSATYSEVYNNSYKLPKVIAVCDIPRDTVSEEIFAEYICGKLENIGNQLEIGLNDNKELSLKSRSNTKHIHWIRSIRLADDCHNYNAKLCMQNQFGRLPKLFIQITKPIKTGQELLLWFSEDILANLQMAFLTPANIQGQKKYVCNLCSTTFEYPNPLKLHLTLDCGKQQIHTIWDRLARSINSQLNTIKPYGFQIKLNDPISNKPKNYSILNLTKTNELNKTTYTPLNLSPVPTKSSLSPNYEIQRPYSEPSIVHSSAFKPYPSTIKKLSPNNNTIRLTQSISNFTTIPQNFSLNNSPQLIPPNNLLEVQTQNFSPIDHAAQMETIVSNLGKSKQGHLCIYCGKCYSRKYGLKIHIRTHTGYKPLKCKFCLRPFGDPSNLNKHVRLHAEGDTPYKCDLCGKVLVRRRDLERHLRSRHMGDMHLGNQEVEDTINSSNSDHSED